MNDAAAPNPLASQLAGDADRPPPPPPESKPPPPKPSPPARPRRGVLPRAAVRTAAFAIISLSIFLCGVLCLLAVWDFTTGDVSWRAVTSLGIVAAMMGMFVFVNELFGGVDGARRSDVRPRR